MNPKNYTSLETSKRLKELGVLQKSDALWWAWSEHDPKFAHLRNNDGGHDKHGQVQVCAFNASELGVLISSQFSLPYCATEKLLETGQQHGFWYAGAPIPKAEFTTEVKARAALLIDIIEEELEDINEINERYTKYLEQ